MPVAFSQLPSSREELTITRGVRAIVHGPPARLGMEGASLISVEHASCAATHVAEKGLE